MSSPYRYGKTSGISTVAIVIVVVVVIAGLGVGVFLVLPQLSSDTQASLNEEKMTYDRFGISFAYPDRIDLREYRILGGDREFSWRSGQVGGEDARFLVWVVWGLPAAELRSSGVSGLNDLNLNWA